MNIYSVYTNSSKKQNNLIFIKQGFSFLAAILNLAWACYHRMWFIAIITIILSCFVGISSFSNVDDSINIVADSVDIAILFLFGFFASEMREYHAKKNNFELSDIILANSEEEAEIKYFMRINSKNN